MHREVEAYNHANSFAHKAAAWKVVCQSVFAKAKLPSWDKCVRLFADERKWADDLLEDWPQFFPGFLRPGESVITGLALAKRLYDDIDHEVWWAAEILQSIESEEQARARQIIPGLYPAECSLVHSQSWRGPNSAWNQLL